MFKIQIIKNYNFNLVICLFYLISILAFFLNLDPNGGAYLDYINQKRISNIFANDFLNSLFNYDKFSTRHSPVLLIILSFLEKANLPDLFIRLIAFHFCLLLPIFFYKLLSLKFENYNKKNLLLLTCLIFLSPTFVSLSIWPDSRIYGLIFFTISLIYYIKFKKKTNLTDAFKCTFWYAIASYFSLNFSLFSIFFIFNFFIVYRLRKETFYLILLNIALALPALVYTFSLENIFFFKSAVPSGEITIKESLNISNKILIISSIFFFYLIPLLFSKLIKINFLNLKFLILSFVIVFIFSLFFNYNFDLTGGGIFFKISQYLFNSNFIFFIIVYISLITILNIIKIDWNNALIIAILILSNPQYTIYHKYYDPLLLILFFSIFEFKLNNDTLKKIKFSYFYIFSVIFLALNFLKQV